MVLLPILSGYAGFWQRFVAFLIDHVLFGLVILPLYFVGSGLFAAVTGSPLLLYTLLACCITLPLWLYYALCECSRLQATPGKWLLGLKVTDEQGGRLGFAQASLRFFAKFLSACAWNIGFLMVAFTRRKQGLHDLLARALVVER